MVTTSRKRKADVRGRNGLRRKDRQERRVVKRRGIDSLPLQARNHALKQEV